MRRSEFIKTLGLGATVYSLVPMQQAFALRLVSPGAPGGPDWLSISGIYPHLAVFNQGGEKLCRGAGGECGIGAIVPWAGSLWVITYSPHCPKGSADRLYAIDADLNLTVQPDSVGGTPADRMIHRESNQLIIGPYFIDPNRKIRVIPPEKMPGRLTAVARHLHDPANRVYFYDMEGKLYEANVHTLEPTLLFEKPVPGWHGKGAYTAQGRLVLANNGDAENKTFDIKPGMLEVGSTSQNEEEKGVLAEWDGKNWSIVRRRQFTEVTGPGGIYGSPDDTAPAWCLGWDRRSVILMLLDHGEWTEFRLPKATHTYDSPNGWYTEWTRIREVTGNKVLMDMHGMLYEFPRGFSLEHTAGIRPLCNHLTIITDFCAWKDQIVLSTDETTMMENKLPGQSQSNLWFGSWDELSSWGPSSGWGGVWQQDAVKAGIGSDPYLVGGFEKKVVHLTHRSGIPVTFSLELCRSGQWEIFTDITVAPNAYEFYIFPDSLEADWIRVRTHNDCVATVYFHYFSRGHEADGSERMFDGIAGVGDDGYNRGLVRPASYNRNLQYLSLTGKKRHDLEGNYYEIDEKMQFLEPETGRGKEVGEICSITKDFEITDTAVVVKDRSGTYCLPKTSALYDQPFETGWPRGKREVMTERSLLNVHGTLYEIANQTGMATMRPICTHRKRIIDFCSWRGLMVISGTKRDAGKDGHYFSTKKGSAGLWFGNVDDLWKLGQPVGHGGPWKDTDVKARDLSLPYLMTGYDKKSVELSSTKDVSISLEVDFDHNGWYLYKTFDVPAGKTITYSFPDGYSAHWIRAVTDKDAKVTVQFLYS